MNLISKLFIALLLYCFTLAFVFSQDIGRSTYLYARKIVDTLTSQSMHGRGYVNDGDKIAADYIKGEFQKLSLQTFGDDYYQHFSFPVNTYPGELQFNCTFYDKEKTIVFKGIPGQNYLVYPSSPSINASFSTVVFDSTYTTSAKKFEKFRKKIKSKNVFVIIDDHGVTDKAKLNYFKKVKEGYFEINIIELVTKLTWRVSQDVSKYVRIQVPADSFKFASKGEGTINIENKFIPDHITQNVIAYVKGTQYPDSFIVFSAHYDHLGQMGRDAYFPGANDNASGCAMLLNLANYYSMPRNKPKYSIAFIAFAGEEAGLLGSKYYTEHPLFPLKNISFVLNMDIMGTGEEGITVVNGSVFKKEFDTLVSINAQNNYLKEIKIRGKAANSDHYCFSEKGVKAFFIYTMGGIKAYHDIYDRSKTLPLNEFEDLYKLIIKFADSLQYSKV
jgi:aminopeptidase YwaD